VRLTEVGSASGSNHTGVGEIL